MEAQEIKSEDYNVYYDMESETVHFQGKLCLGGSQEYAPMTQLLNEVMVQSPSSLTLNFQQLEFLNSSGISMIAKFIIRLRQKPPMQVLVIGSQEIPWQGKSLKNLEKLLPGLQLKIV
jgi:hypothetical protein